MMVSKEGGWLGLVFCGWSVSDLLVISYDECCDELWLNIFGLLS